MPMPTPMPTHQTVIQKRKIFLYKFGRNEKKISQFWKKKWIHRRRRRRRPGILGKSRWGWNSRRRRRPRQRKKGIQSFSEINLRETWEFCAQIHSNVVPGCYYLENTTSSQFPYEVRQETQWTSQPTWEGLMSNLISLSSHRASFVDGSVMMIACHSHWFSGDEKMIRFEY